MQIKGKPVPRKGQFRKPGDTRIVRIDRRRAERLPCFFPRREVGDYLAAANICLDRESLSPGMPRRIRELGQKLIEACPAGTTHSLFYLTLASLLDAETARLLERKLDRLA